MVWNLSSWGSIKPHLFACWGMSNRCWLNKKKLNSVRHGGKHIFFVIKFQLLSVSPIPILVGISEVCPNIHWFYQDSPVDTTNLIVRNYFWLAKTLKNHTNYIIIYIYITSCCFWSSSFPGSWYPHVTKRPQDVLLLGSQSSGWIGPICFKEPTMVIHHSPLKKSPKYPCMPII